MGRIIFSVNAFFFFFFKPGQLLLALNKFPPTPAGSADVAAGAEAMTFLRDLVKIDTSNPPGDEIKAANYIKGVLDREGIPSDIFESAPGRANLVARLRGKRQKEASDADGASGCGRRGARQVDPRTLRSDHKGRLPVWPRRFR